MVISTNICAICHQRIAACPQYIYDLERKHDQYQSAEFDNAGSDVIQGSKSYKKTGSDNVTYALLSHVQTSLLL
jgi:Na+-translocating ferredoxin:NAD+ oxidoreductase RNF subunit RnfB